MPPQTDNLRLEELYLSDQKDRENVYTSSEAVRQLQERDAMRRQLVYEMMAREEINTANDLYRAAVICYHGTEPKDFLSAHRLSTMAAVNASRPARFIAAASLDRFLMAVGLPQVYGTQFELDADTGQYQLRLPIDDSRVLNSEKRFFNVPPVADRLGQLNEKAKTKK